MTDPEVKVENAVEFFSKTSSDRLAKLIRVVTEKLEKNLFDIEVPARVAARVKNPASLRDKLLRWAKNPKKQNQIGEEQYTLNHVGDLAAVRVMTYTERDRRKVANMVTKVFQTPPGVDGFNQEDKAEDLRIKSDENNHYRAIHMQVCLRDEDLTGNLDNLKDDHFELQITSMLAHVWNEIEHDTIYKAKSGVLSKEEKGAVDSLGLLTKTGDNIIQSLLQSRRVREIKDKSDADFNSGRIENESQLVDFLREHFGDKVAGEKIDFNIGSRELLDTLTTQNMHHPVDLSINFSPKRLIEAKRIGRKLQKFQQKAETSKSSYRPQSCDLFLVASFMVDGDALVDKFRGLHSNKREVALFNVYREICS
jgi:ppGpp synthetase/RelA/SpoT-type nucleotidyltranferase